jgi:hypothetical protein
MQPLRSITAFVMCLGCFGASLACATEPPKSKRACFEAIDKGEQMLAVPDFEAAKGWLGRAKKECLADQAQGVARLEKAIGETQVKVAEKAKKREESFKPKPANESLVPGFVEAVVKYRDNKKRAQCEADPCAEVAAVGTLTVRESTAKGARDAFRVFTRFTSERVACEQLGASEVKRRSEDQAQITLHCAITGGTLSGLSALVEQEKERPATYVVVFSDKWLEHDPELRSKVGGSPAPANSAP